MSQGHRWKRNPVDTKSGNWEGGEVESEIEYADGEKNEKLENLNMAAVLLIEGWRPG